jgi:hypothetical protein
MTNRTLLWAASCMITLAMGSACERRAWAPTPSASIVRIESATGVTLPDGASVMVEESGGRQGEAYSVWLIQSSAEPKLPEKYATGFPYVRTTNLASSVKLVNSVAGRDIVEAADAGWSTDWEHASLSFHATVVASGGGWFTVVQSAGADR